MTLAKDRPLDCNVLGAHHVLVTEQDQCKTGTHLVQVAISSSVGSCETEVPG